MGYNVRADKNMNVRHQRKEAIQSVDLLIVKHVRKDTSKIVQEQYISTFVAHIMPSGNNITLLNI